MPPKSLADSTALIAQFAASTSAEIRRTTSVIAPCCGRKVAADMVADLRGIPNTETHPGGGRRRELEWACDGCRERLAREPIWSRAKLMRARDYPWPTIKQMRANELTWQEMRQSTGPYNPQAIREQKMAELPDTDIPGTEPPTS